MEQETKISGTAMQDSDVTIQSEGSIMDTPSESAQEEATGAEGVKMDIPVDTGARFQDKQITMLSISLIDKESWHPRIGDGSHTQLKASIKREGIITPLTVMASTDGRFSVIDGTRRLKVARDLGISTAPCVIHATMGDANAANMAFVTNAERESFTPIEEAQHFKLMKDTFGLNLREMEVKLNRSKTHISNRLSLLDLPESVQKHIIKGDITSAHGIALTRLPSAKEQERMAKQIVEHEIPASKTSVRVTRYLSRLSKKETKADKVQVPAGNVPGVYFKDSKDMCEIPDKSVSLVVSSPPYNVGKEFEKDVPHDVHLEEIEAVIKEIARVTTPGAVIALNVGDIHYFKGNSGTNKEVQMELMGHKIQKMLRKHNILLEDMIIRKKEKNWSSYLPVLFDEDTQHTSYRLLHNYDAVYIFRKKGERELPPEDVILRSKLSKEQWTAWCPAVWEIDSVWKNEGHPAQYPDELCYRLIKMFSYEGDTVLDPWLGSGTTVKVARELSRNAVGYERDLKYKQVIMRKLGLLENARPVSMVDFASESLAEAETNSQGEGGKSSEQPAAQAEFFTNASNEADIAVQELDQAA